jgi:8-oxo-dGTP pyrophosphatase MutT (NUDIX family)
MTRRAMHLKYHAGEVSFPGGVFEEQDDDLLATALRETEEELAIQVESEDVLGQLPVVSTRLGFEITPFVSVLPSAPKYEPAENEVGEVLEMPFTSLLSTQQRDVGSNPSEEGVMYWFERHRIWGASAKILKQISHLSSY